MVVYQVIHDLNNLTMVYFYVNSNVKIVSMASMQATYIVVEEIKIDWLVNNAITRTNKRTYIE